MHYGVEMVLVLAIKKHNLTLVFSAQHQLLQITYNLVL